MNQTGSRKRAFAWIVVAYAVALAVATVTLQLVPSESVLWRTFFADVAATITIFAFSVAFKNSSFYDAYWSVVPPVLVLVWISQPSLGPEPNDVRTLIAFGLMCTWAVRLTYNWARGWTGLDHEDWRYQDLHAKFPRVYWLVSFGGIHMLPTLQVFLGSLPLYYVAVRGGGPLGWVDAAAVIVTAVGIACEAIGDKQLHDFVTGPRKPGEILTTGLWRYSRHPNYFGEITFWWGMALFGIAAAPNQWLYCIAGATGITLLFSVVSLSLIEQRNLERRPGYADVIRRTSILIPWFPRE